MTKIFEYLSKGHQMTSMGLLLGMAATRRGTMDAGVAKLLSIHLPVLLSPSPPC
jgi:anaphase-promoting complex subunit 1